jgi:hypothetical protein
MNGRTLSVDSAVSSLMRKGVSFSGRSIDIAHAKPIGNKSWGCIDFLRKKENGYYVENLDKYQKLNRGDK